MLMAIALSNCTQTQRFALLKNAELDRCAMQRMAETQINGQHGYLQARHECHWIVNTQKFMNTERDTHEAYQNHFIAVDPLKEYAFCWELVKGLYIDELYPDELAEKTRKMDSKSIWDAQDILQASNEKFNKLPNRISEIATKKLIEIYELMAVNSAVTHKSACNARDYHELRAKIGRVIQQRP